MAANALAACGADDPPTNRSGAASSASRDDGAPAPAPAPNDDFAGEWESTFGRLKLTGSGDRLQGTYEFCAGALSGTTRGNRLEGTWKEDTSACTDSVSAARPIAEGTFSFTLDTEGDAFTGYYETRGSPERNKWNGTRVAG